MFLSRDVAFTILVAALCGCSGDARTLEASLSQFSRARQHHFRGDREICC